MFFSNVNHKKWNNFLNCVFQRATVTPSGRRGRRATRRLASVPARTESPASPAIAAPRATNRAGRISHPASVSTWSDILILCRAAHGGQVYSNRLQFCLTAFRHAHCKRCSADSLPFGWNWVSLREISFLGEKWNEVMSGRLQSLSNDGNQNLGNGSKNQIWKIDGRINVTQLLVLSLVGCNHRITRFAQEFCGCVLLCESWITPPPCRLSQRKHWALTLQRPY